MRVLMVNSNRLRLVRRPVLPFGLCCVAAAIEQAGHEVGGLDLLFADDCDRAIADALERFHPDVVGVSVRNIDNASGVNPGFMLHEIHREVIAPLKARFCGPIVLGGSAVGINASEMLQLFDLELAIAGDGEIAMVELLERLAEVRDLSDCPGLVRRQNGKIVQANPPARVQDLDRLPRVQFQRYVDLRPYAALASPLQVQSKRGCELQCVYCTYRTIEGEHYRLRAPNKVADDIGDLVESTGTNQIELTDSTFNVPLPHAKQVLRAIIAKKLPLRLSTMGLHPGAIDDELCDLMMEAGFEHVGLGAEAACDVTLRGLGKSFTKADVIRCARLLKKRELPVAWYLLLGAPGETQETVAETLSTITELAAPTDLIAVSVGMRAYKGAPIAERMLASNRHCTTDNFLTPVAYEPAGISLEAITALTRLHATYCPSILRVDEELRFDAVTRLAWALQCRRAARDGKNLPPFGLPILRQRLRRLVGLHLLERSRLRRAQRHTDVRRV